MSSTAASTAFCASPAGSSGSDPAIAKLLCSMRQIQEELQVGWAVVKEYDADALADNSNDERIEKAEKAAERKVVTKLQEGKQREGGARKNVARPSSEPALEPRFPSWGPRMRAVECRNPGFQWVLVLGVVTQADSRGNAQRWRLRNIQEHVPFDAKQQKLNFTASSNKLAQLN
ncbi:hypothetical protein EMCRGX_G023258 [Ephydatia muelleri]